MAERSIRFGVKDDIGNRAATWKLWTRVGGGKSDVYLACRSLGGTLKASLHESGSWHIGFLRSFLSAELADDDRRRERPYIDRWPRPPEIGPGVTLAYRILVPASAVNIPFSSSPASSIVWLPSAPPGKAIEFDIVVTAANARVTSWPGQRSMQNELVGKLSLDNGETTWVVCRIVDVPEFELPRGSNPTLFNSAHDRPVTADDKLRAILFGNAADGSRFIVDCAVSYGRESPMA